MGCIVVVVHCLAILKLKAFAHRKGHFLYNENPYRNSPH